MCTCASAAEEGRRANKENGDALAGVHTPSDSVDGLPSADDAHLHSPGDDTAALANGAHIDQAARLAEFAEFAEDPDIAAMADLSEDEFESVLAEARADGDLSRSAVATKARALKAGETFCRACRGLLDPKLAAAGDTTHPNCEVDHDD